MKTFEVTAHYSHSVNFIIRAKNEEEAMEMIEERGFDVEDNNYKWNDGNFEELVSIDYPLETIGGI